MPVVIRGTRPTWYHFLLFIGASAIAGGALVWLTSDSRINLNCSVAQFEEPTALSTDESANQQADFLTNHAGGSVAKGKGIDFEYPSGEYFVRSAAMSLLHSLPKDKRLSLKEREAMAAVYVEFQEIRARYEADLVEVISHANGELHLTIPPYTEAGRALRDRFYDALRSVLSANSYHALIDHAGESIDERFLAFGICHQVFRITPWDDSSGLGKRYRIVREVVPLDGTTTWDLPGPRFAGATSTATYSLEQLRHSTYAGIVDSIEVAFKN